MSRMPALTLDTANVKQRELLERTQHQLGRIPNLYATMANSPTALRGYLAFRDALLGGELGAKLRERLALLAAQDNNCAYCVAAHTMRGSRMGLTDADLLATRRADNDDPHTRAVLTVAHEAHRTGGALSDEALAEARAAGVTDGQLGEIIAHLALNLLSNYFNHLARPELDFPAVDLRLPA